MKLGVEGVAGPCSYLVEERTKAAFQAQDAARRAYLDRLIFEQGRCRYCGARLADKVLERHPGLCARGSCRRAARADSASLHR